VDKNNTCTTPTLYVSQFSEATCAPEGPGGRSVQSVHFSIVVMGEEAELQAKVVALINRHLGDSLAEAPLITAFRDELEAKRRCVETRYEPLKNSFASAGGGDRDLISIRIQNPDPGGKR
jgi:hypothetical protein